LDHEQTKELKEIYQEVCNVLFSKTRIIATTLGNASNDLFRSGYEPVFLVCDEAGQCTEGDLAIALTLPFLRAFVLIGDPDQLPPTIIFENLNNEGANYLKRSLMERLLEAEYPCTTLTSHYRSHPEIMDFSSRHVYKGALVNMVSDRPTRVDYVWHEFTRSRHHFYQNGLENLRRLFISIDGYAAQKENSTSWFNTEQVEALCQFLRALYTFEAPNGMKISVADVMVVSPFQDQRKLIRDELLEWDLEVHKNLTFDASQGQEAPLVFILLTKPSADRAGLGILSNKHRLNVAFSRATDVLIVFGNLRVWYTASIDYWSQDPTRKHSLKRCFLVKFLSDVSEKGHTLTWNGGRTVTEEKAPGDFSDYPSHDWSRRGKRYYTFQTPVPPAPEPHETEATALALTAPADTGDADSSPSVVLSSSIGASTVLTDPSMPRCRKEQWVQLLKESIKALENQLDAGIDIWTGMPMVGCVRARIMNELGTLTGLMTQMDNWSTCRPVVVVVHLFLSLESDSLCFFAVCLCNRIPARLSVHLSCRMRPALTLARAFLVVLIASTSVSLLKAQLSSNQAHCHHPPSQSLTPCFLDYSKLPQQPSPYERVRHQSGYVRLRDYAVKSEKSQCPPISSSHLPA
jgi:hypothetical protein